MIKIKLKELSSRYRDRETPQAVSGEIRIVIDIPKPKYDEIARSPDVPLLAVGETEKVVVGEASGD